MRRLLAAGLLAASGVGCGGVEPPAVADRPRAICGPAPAEQPASEVLGVGARGMVYGSAPVFVRFVTSPVATGRPPRVPLGTNGAVKLSLTLRPSFDGPVKLRIAPVGQALIARFQDSEGAETTVQATAGGNGVHALGLLLPAEGCYRLLVARPDAEPDVLFFRAV